MSDARNPGRPHVASLRDALNIIGDALDRDEALSAAVEPLLYQLLNQYLADQPGELRTAVDRTGYEQVPMSDHVSKVVRSYDVGIRRTSERSIDVRIGDRSLIVTSDPVDQGPALLEPITVTEIRGVEAALTILERAIEAEMLSEFQERRIRAMLEVLGYEIRKTIPETTPRWQLVGTTRSTFRFIAFEMPSVVGWVEIAHQLHKIGWPHVAGILG